MTALLPGADLNAAYQAAAPGDVFDLGPGDYGNQKILPRADKNAMAQPVTFKGALGGGPVFGRLSINGSGVGLENLECTGIGVRGDAVTKFPAGSKLDPKVCIRNFAFRDVICKGNFNLHRTENFSWIGGEITPPAPVNTDPQMTSHINTLLENLHIHGFVDVGPGQVNHIEGLQIGSADGLTIRGCDFDGNATHDIFFRAWGNMYNGEATPFRGVLIEDCLFRAVTATPGYYAMQLMDDLVPASEGETDAEIRNCVFEMGLAFRLSKGTIHFHHNKYPGYSAYGASTMKNGAFPVDAHDNILKGGAVYFPGDVIDPNVDLTTAPKAGTPPVVPPVTPPVTPPPVDPCQVKVDAAVQPLEAQIAQLTADAAMATSKVSTLTAALTEIEAEAEAALA